MTDTVETLSVPNQQLNAEYFRRVLALSNKSVIAAPCGYGKTLGIADYIASHYRQGILYVAERQEQLTDMRNNLKVRDVPYYDIAVYHNDTDERRKTAPITLITHSRLFSFPVTDFLTYHHGHQQMRRNLLVIDEALPSLLIFKVPELVATGFLHKMKMNWDDCGNLSEEQIRDRINSISRLISQHAAYPFQEVNITYNQLDWTNNAYIDTNVSKQVRENGYRHILFQLLQGNYRKDNESIYVYISPFKVTRDSIL